MGLDELVIFVDEGSVHGPGKGRDDKEHHQSNGYTKIENQSSLDAGGQDAFLLHNTPPETAPPGQCAGYGIDMVCYVLLSFMYLIRCHNAIRNCHLRILDSGMGMANGVGLDRNTRRLYDLISENSLWETGD